MAKRPEIGEIVMISSCLWDDKFYPCRRVQDDHDSSLYFSLYCQYPGEQRFIILHRGLSEIGKSWRFPNDDDLAEIARLALLGELYV